MAARFGVGSDGLTRQWTFAAREETAVLCLHSASGLAISAGPGNNVAADVLERRTGRESMKLLSISLLFGAVLGAGCTLITDVDRDDISESEGSGGSGTDGEGGAAGTEDASGGASGDVDEGGGGGVAGVSTAGAAGSDSGTAGAAGSDAETAGAAGDEG